MRLFEQRIMDRNAGYMLNADLETYKILGAREVPEIRDRGLVENYFAQSSTDAAGIGESAGIITLARGRSAMHSTTPQGCACARFR